MALTEKQLAFLDENPFVGVATTLRPDGSPHSTVVWVDVVDGGVEFNTATGRAKERYLKADPRVSLLVIDPANAYRWVAVAGKAQLTEDGADPQIDKLAKKYINQDVYPWRKDTEQRISVRIGAEHVDSAGIEEAAH